MSTASDLKDRIERLFDGQLDNVKRQLFGVNNERLDFFMDSFYKLDPRERGLLIGALIGVIFGFVVLAISLYFIQVSSLRSELNESFSALHKLRALKIEEKVESARFDQLVDSIKLKTKGLAFKPFFERLSRDVKVSISNLREDKIDFDAANPMSDKVKQVRVSMKLPKVSIPKLLKFLVETEKSGKYLRVSDVKITGLYGNKLFFDANIVVRGYAMSR